MTHLTIPDDDAIVSYTVTSSTTGPFAVSFPITDDEDLRVDVGGVELAASQFVFTPTTTVTGGYQAGTVSLVTAVSSTTVTIWRDVPARREDDFAKGPLDMDALNTALDRVTAQIQDLKNPMNWPADEVTLVVSQGAQVSTNVADMQARAAGSASIVAMLGRTTAGDGGEGLFYWDAAATDTHDGSMVIRPTAVSALAAGRFKRLCQRGYYEAGWFGAKFVGGDDTTGLNDFGSYLNTNGGEGRLPAGEAITTAAWLIDQSAVSTDSSRRRIWIRGPGDGACHVYGQHGGRVLDIRGNSGDGLGKYLHLSGFRIKGSGIANSVGLWLDNCAWFHIEDMTFMDHDLGIDGTDCLSGTFETCRIRFNIRGYRFQYADVSRPNAITMQDVILGANYHYGGNVIGAAAFNIRGGSIEGNGVTGSTPYVGGFGVKATDCGVEGATGVVMEGVYCEGNADTADIWIAQTISSPATMHSIRGSSFSRISSSYYATNNILFDDASGNSRCDVRGCGFKGLNSYTESSGRKYWKAPGGNMYVDPNCVFGSTTALPSVNLADQAADTGHLVGCTLSNNSLDTANDVDNTTGYVVDDTGKYMMKVPALTKRLDALWAAGTNQGGRESGSMTNTTYWAAVVGNHTTGDTEVVYVPAANVSAPTLPSGYTLKRYIGFVQVSGGSIIQFKQRGDYFEYQTVTNAFTAVNNPGTSAVTQTVTNAPTGFETEADIVFGLTDNSPGVDTILTVTALTQADVAAGTTNGLIYIPGVALAAGGVTADVRYSRKSVWLNTSGQFRFRVGFSDADIFVGGRLNGFRWDRGRTG